jgi:hypothetical protein
MAGKSWVKPAAFVAYIVLLATSPASAQDARYATSADKRAACQSIFAAATEAKAMLRKTSSQDDALRVAQIVVTDYRAGKLGYGLGTDTKALDNIHSIALTAWSDLIDPPSNPIQSFSTTEFLSDCLKNAG